MNKTIIVIMSGATLFGLGIVAGGGWGHLKSVALTRNQNETVANYPLINKATTASLGKHFIINFLPLKEKFVSIKAKYSQKTYIYFAYLNNATWIGLNERDLFTAASTVKVPLAMSIYKMAQENKLKVTDTYGLEELDLNDTFGELYKVGLDKVLTVEELIKIMLEKSDNTAANATYKILGRIGIEQPLDNVYNFMGWQFNEFGKKPDYERINLKTLSNMFLSLYNATYNSVDDSNKILEFLSATPFKDKIVAGVPEDIVVAHKIGIASNNETFSDCGIVYAPNRHYILCLGSNGGDEKAANAFMRDISQAAYQFVIKN